MPASDSQRRRPSSKGESDHTVYRFERLASVDGRATEPLSANDGTRGTVVRFNCAKRGEPNGAGRVIEAMSANGQPIGSVP